MFSKQLSKVLCDCSLGNLQLLVMMQFNLFVAEFYGGEIKVKDICADYGSNLCQNSTL